MSDQNKTKAQLIKELDQTRKLVAKLKHAEEALRESEEKFKSLADRSPNMIFVNKQGRVVYVNHMCEEIMGYTKEEFYSPDFDFMSLIAPESLGWIRAKFQEHMQGKDIPPYEYTLITKAGKRIEAINVPKLIHYEGDTAILGIVTDITQRKRTEEALRESEEMYRSFIERANDGIAIIQDNAIIKYVNRRVAAMIGYEVEELIGAPFARFVPTEMVQDLTGRYRKRLAGETIPPIYEIRLLKKNGEPIDVEINAGVIQFEGKEADLALIRDITERKRTRKALEESEQRFRELVEAASDVVYTTNADGYFTYVNPPVKKLTGYTCDELLGVHFSELVAPEWRDRVESFYRQQLDDLVRDSRLEFPIITRSGEEKWIEQRVTMLVEGNEVTGAQSIVRDITERKKTETILQQMATIDPLTSLYNRRRFSEFLNHEIDRTKRYQANMSIIMFDIDHFKKINDTYGHKEGDRVLKEFGTRIKHIIRESDLVARWGGEEFMVLALNTDLKNAQLIAEKIRADIESQHFSDTTGFTISAGVTQFKDGDDTTSLLDRVDQALYKAKNEGRNTVRVV